MDITKIVEKAQELSNYFDWKEFDNGTKRVICTADFDSQAWKECHEILHKVDDNTSLGQDSRYIYTMEALGLIVDRQPNSEELLNEIGYEQEPDIYTSQLTEWLNESNEHVYYLTEVLEEYEPKDGFALLTMAQGKAMEEAYQAVVEALIELTGEQEQIQA